MRTCRKLARILLLTLRGLAKSAKDEREPLDKTVLHVPPFPMTINERQGQTLDKVNWEHICLNHYSASKSVDKRTSQGEDLHFKRVYVDPRIPVSDIIPRIINGHEVVPHSIPYQAYLIITDDSGSRWLCGGSLISPSHVLTAAHCVVDSVSAEVYLGVHNTQVVESTRILVTSRNLINHERYNDRYIRNDIGLITLPAPVELNENVNVVSLPRSGASTDYEGANVRVSGWGLTDGHGDVSPVLREVNSTVISNRQCDRVFGIVENTQVCVSGNGGVSACNGDSGGPLIAGNVQIGIVSFGVEYCVEGYPSAFTRVSSYLDWIETHTGLKF